MLGQIRNALLGNHDVRSSRDDLGTDVLDVLLLDPQESVPILFFGDLHIRIAIAFFVF